MSRKSRTPAAMSNAAAPIKSPAWLLLITNLPGRNATLRMRLWRGLKAAGAGLLRDGAYMLPNSEKTRRVLEEHGAGIKAAGGLVQILAFNAETAEQQAAFEALFDRSSEYAAANGELGTLKRQLAKLREPEVRQRIASLRREIAETIGRDFFPGESQKQIENALADAEAAINARFAPDEPRSAHRALRPRVRKNYRGRTWATRERLWVDRVASAWLIRRFIDPEAKFLWLKHKKDCPKRAVGFDFDGAEFTHVDSKVTFEVLLSCFALEGDHGLTRIGALVHRLDVGGIPVAEGPGFVSILAGIRALQPDDDSLLTAMTPVMDALYAAYSDTPPAGATLQPSAAAGSKAK